MKILILGPIEDTGGREVETGVISNILSKKHIVQVLSTTNLSHNSQVYKHHPEAKCYSVKEIIFNKILLVRVLSVFIKILKFRKAPSYFFINNKISKKIIDYDAKVENVIRKFIIKNDIVFLNAQVYSNYIKYVIKECELMNKKVLFRTTGTIYDVLNCENIGLGYTHSFIHHSSRNKNMLEGCKNAIVIDQSAPNEISLLKCPLPKRIINFIAVGRISKEKGFLKLCEYFVRLNNPLIFLNIIGTGPEKASLEEKFKKIKNISFLGFVPNKQLSELFKKTDCLVIPSIEEAGPIVGVEAMAAARVILSTDVGAMKERLNHTKNDFFYDCNDYDSFKKNINRLLNLNEDEIREIAESNRNVYLSQYKKKVIEEKYLKEIERYTI